LVGVHHESGKAIGFAKQETIGLRTRQDALAVSKSLSNAASEEVAIDFLTLTGEEADRDQGMGVVIADAEEGLSAVAQLDEATRRRIALYHSDLVRERPEMAVLDAAMFLGLEDDLWK
jgi:hypothetical protein